MEKKNIQDSLQGDGNKECVTTSVDRNSLSVIRFRQQPRKADETVWSGEMLQKFRLYRTAPYVSGVLVAVNVLIFLWCSFTGNLPGNTIGISPHLFSKTGNTIV